MKISLKWIMTHLKSRVIMLNEYIQEFNNRFILFRFWYYLNIFFLAVLSYVITIMVILAPRIFIHTYEVLYTTKSILYKPRISMKKTYFLVFSR